MLTGNGIVLKNLNGPVNTRSAIYKGTVALDLCKEEVRAREMKVLAGFSLLVCGYAAIFGDAICASVFERNSMNTDDNSLQPLRRVSTNLSIYSLSQTFKKKYYIQSKPCLTFNAFRYFLQVNPDL